MLYPDQFNELPKEIYKFLEEIEDKAIRDIVKSYKKVNDMSPTSLYRYDLLGDLTRDMKKVRENLAKDLNVTQEEIDKIFYEAALESYADDKKMFDIGGHKLPDYKDNYLVQRLTASIIDQTNGSFKNLSNSTGFVFNKQKVPFTKLATKLIDQAIFNTSAGMYTTEQSVSELVDKLGEQGLQYFDFENGSRRNLDGHIRNLIRTGLNQISNNISNHNIEEVGACYVETSAHSGARPSHQVWQGKVYYWYEMDKTGDRNKYNYPDFISSTGLGSGEGLGGWNCRHGYHAFFPGSSKPAYSKKQLDEIDPPAFEYDGREYTQYEANQRMRQLERDIRKSKRKIVGYDAADNKDLFTVESVRLRRLRDNYSNFKEAAKSTEQAQRLKIYGYNRSIQGKAVWADKKISNNKILSEIVNKNWSDDFKGKAINTYQTFEDNGHIMGSHFIGRFLQRKDQNKFTKIDVDDILSAINKGNNYVQDGKKVYFDTDKSFALIQNAENREFITFIRRKTVSKKWQEAK